jgi:hypothetical protein
MRGRAHEIADGAFTPQNVTGPLAECQRSGSALVGLLPRRFVVGANRSKTFVNFYRGFLLPPLGARSN